MSVRREHPSFSGKSVHTVAHRENPMTWGLTLVQPPLFSSRPLRNILTSPHGESSALCFLSVASNSQAHHVHRMCNACGGEVGEPDGSEHGLFRFNRNLAIDQATLLRALEPQCLFRMPLTAFFRHALGCCRNLSHEDVWKLFQRYNSPFDETVFGPSCHKPVMRGHS